MSIQENQVTRLRMLVENLIEDAARGEASFVDNYVNNIVEIAEDDETPFDRERNAYRLNLTTLFEGSPGYVCHPDRKGEYSDPASVEVDTYVNLLWEPYRQTLFSLEGVFYDGTTYGIEFTREDWDKLVAMVEENR